MSMISIARSNIKSKDQKYHKYITPVSIESTNEMNGHKEELKIDPDTSS